MLVLGGERFLMSEVPLCLQQVSIEAGELQVQHALCYALTPNTVELIPAHGALFPRGGPV